MVRKSLDPFIDGLEDLNLGPGLASGHLSLRGLRLKRDLIGHFLPEFSGLDIQPSSHLSSLEIQIPWSGIMKGGVIKVTIQGVHAQLGLLHVHGLDREEVVNYLRTRKHNAIAATEEHLLAEVLFSTKT